MHPAPTHKPAVVINAITTGPLTPDSSLPYSWQNLALLISGSINRVLARNQLFSVHAAFGTARSPT